MSDFPDILNSQIISSEYDIFWRSASDELKQLPPRPVLVASTPFPPDGPEEAQLKKMLQACQLTAEDFHILQFTDDTHLAWHLLRDQLQIKSIILLGLTPDRLGVSAELMPHQLSRFNGCNWIVTLSLEELQQRPEFKTHLWQYGLKPAFVDKVYG